MRHIFTSHPASVGETYFEHLHTASGFGFTMILGGVACLLHGLVPVWFVKTGSQVVTKLHNRMVLNRSRAMSSGYILDFVI